MYKKENILDFTFPDRISMTPNKTPPKTTSVSPLKANPSTSSIEVIKTPSNKGASITATQNS